MYLPTLAWAGLGVDVSPLATRAEAAGWTVLSLEGVYDGHDPDDLRIAPWDHHPNARGHALIADRLYDALREAGFFTTPRRTRSGIEEKGEEHGDAG